MSQLALAAEAAVSIRHLCFLETGRANPSRAMVLKLAEVLDVPLRERNILLLKAGFAPQYPESELDAPSLAAVRDALDTILTQQEPFPALVMDRSWDIRHTNAAARRFFAFLQDGQAKTAPGPANVLRRMFHPDGVRRHVTNWPDVAAALVQRARREAIGVSPTSAPSGSSTRYWTTQGCRPRCGRSTRPRRCCRSCRSSTCTVAGGSTSSPP